jgi:hypothetical protein
MDITKIELLTIRIYFYIVLVFPLYGLYDLSGSVRRV